MTILHKCKLSGRTDRFEVVNKIPKNYEIWNIGDNMADGYLPLCEFKEGYNVNIETLKAIKIEGEELEILRHAVNYGVKDLKSAKKALNRKNPKSYIARKKADFARQTITILEQISE